MTEQRRLKDRSILQSPKQASDFAKNWPSVKVADINRFKVADINRFNG